MDLPYHSGSRYPAVKEIPLDRLPNQRSGDQDDFPAPSSRREYLSMSIPELRRTFEDSGAGNAEDPPISFLQDTSRGYHKEAPLSITPGLSPAARLTETNDLTTSKAVAGAMRALQTKVRTLQTENQSLKQLIAELEQKADTDRTAWKKRLLEEVNVSKTREMELIGRFQRLDSKLKSESKRIKKAETAFKDAEAEFEVKMEQANADNAALELRVHRLESDYRDMAREKSDLDQKCESQAAEIIVLKEQLSSQRPDSPIQDVDPDLSSSRPKPGRSEIMEIAENPTSRRTESERNLIDEIRREIAEVRESVARPRSVSISSQETHIARYLQEKPVPKPMESLGEMKRSASVQATKKEPETESYKLKRGGSSYAGFSKLLAASPSIIVFKPTLSGKGGNPRVNFESRGRPVLGRGPVKA